MLTLTIIIKINIILIFLSFMMVLIKQASYISILICMEIIFLNLILIAEIKGILYGSLGFEKLSLICFLIAGADSAIILTSLYGNSKEIGHGRKKKIKVRS